MFLFLTYIQYLKLVPSKFELTTERHKGNLSLKFLLRPKLLYLHKSVNSYLPLPFVNSSPRVRPNIFKLSNHVPTTSPIKWMQVSGNLRVNAGAIREANWKFLRSRFALRDRLYSIFHGNFSGDGYGK